MASIIAKPFDAAKRIVKAVFRGSPNLYTTADVNRQVDAFKYQVDQIEDRMAMVFAENLTISATIVGTTLSVVATPTIVGNMKVKSKGCEFNLGNVEVTKSATADTSAGARMYLVLKGDQELITFSDDPTHEISGATFGDGTPAMAASDHYQYDVDTLELDVVSEATLPTNLIVILACITNDGEGNLTILKGFYNSDKLGIIAKRENLVQERLYKNLASLFEVKAGMQYDQILSVLARNMVPVKTVLPFYSELNVDAIEYGWIPCVGLYAFNAYTPVAGGIEDKYKALYGSTNVTFVVKTGHNGKHYVSIDKVRQNSGSAWIYIPDLTAKFLAGSNADTTEYDLGSTGGVNSVTLTAAQSGLQAHTHTNTLSTRTKHILSDGAGSQYVFSSDSEGNIHSMQTQLGVTVNNCASKSAVSSHENRPPFMAIAYIMRVW